MKDRQLTLRGMIGAFPAVLTMTEFTAGRPGEPLGAFVAAMVAIELGTLVSGKTKVDIIVTPAVSIISGAITGLIVGPPISAFMYWLGELVNINVSLHPIIGGIAISVLMGMILTLPISSAAIGISMSGFGLAEELHISRKQAESYIAEYFEKHQAVKTFMDGQVAGCKANGYTRTILGRKRYINEINSSNYMVRQLGERLAMNSPIQGSAADVIKIAMIRVYHELKEKNYKSRLVLQIHDELIILTSRDEIDAVSELLVRNMEEAMDLSVKLECDLNTADSWYDLK